MENLEGLHHFREFSERYRDNFWLSVVGDRMERILEKWQGDRFSGDWRVLKGARVLDLGCGTALPDSCYVYEPFFCRLATYNGADVTGVDRFQALPEDAAEFNCIQADFVEAIVKGQLRDLFSAQKNFNIIHMWRLWDTGDREMKRSLNKLGLTDYSFIRLLGPQVYSLLAQDGLLAAENQFVRKNGSEFIKV